MLSVFEKIINRQLPAYIIHENQEYIAILSKDQLQKGHTLVIPKIKIDKYTDMTDQDFRNLQSYALTIAKKLKNAFPNKARIVMNIVGFEVEHLHIHLIPSNTIEEALHSRSINMSDEEFKSILKEIQLQF